MYHLLIYQKCNIVNRLKWQRVIIIVILFPIKNEDDWSGIDHIPRFHFTRIRLYCFPNGRKCALFGSYLHVQFHKNRPFSHASTKNVFKNVFTEMVLKRCYIFWKGTALFRDMYDAAFTDNSISYAIHEVQSKKQLKQHLIIACWKCYTTDKFILSSYFLWHYERSWLHEQWYCNL